MAKRVADVAVETLQAAGVKHCGGVPGDTLNFVTDAIRRSDIKWVTSGMRRSAALPPVLRR
jgi:pyruvate dehydrogenase (quinone)